MNDMNDLLPSAAGQCLAVYTQRNTVCSARCTALNRHSNDDGRLYRGGAGNVKTGGTAGAGGHGFPYGGGLADRHGRPVVWPRLERPNL